MIVTSILLLLQTLILFQTVYYVRIDHLNDKEALRTMPNTLALNIL